jgi:hypothetical protein
MDSNTHSTGGSGGVPDRLAGLAGLAAAVDRLAAQDLDRLPDAALAEQVLVLRGLLDRLEGTGSSSWPPWMAAAPPGPTRTSRSGRPRPGCAAGCGWAPGAASSSVGTARAVFRGPLSGTARALTDGVLSPAHAAVLAHGTQELAARTAADAEPVLVEAASRLDPPRLRRVLGHLRAVADPEGADALAELARRALEGGGCPRAAGSDPS